MMARIKEKDTVFIISGKDKGKKGTVLKILTKKNKVIVKDCGIVTKHAKQRKQTDVAGIKKVEGALPLSKVMLVCSACKTPCRVKIKILENEQRKRSCVRCQEVI